MNVKIPHPSAAWLNIIKNEEVHGASVGASNQRAVVSEAHAADELITAISWRSFIAGMLTTLTT